MRAMLTESPRKCRPVYRDPLTTCDVELSDMILWKDTATHSHAYTFTCIHAYTFACLHKLSYSCSAPLQNIFTCLHICMLTQAFIFMLTHLHAYTFTCIHAYTSFHIPTEAEHEGHDAGFAGMFSMHRKASLVCYVNSNLEHGSHAPLACLSLPRVIVGCCPARTASTN